MMMVMVIVLGRNPEVYTTLFCTAARRLSDKLHSAAAQRRSSARLPDKLIENHAALSLNTLVGIFYLVVRRPMLNIIYTLYTLYIYYIHYIHCHTCWYSVRNTNKCAKKHQIAKSAAGTVAKNNKSVPLTCRTKTSIAAREPASRIRIRSAVFLHTSADLYDICVNKPKLTPS